MAAPAAEPKMRAASAFLPWLNREGQGNRDSRSATLGLNLNRLDNSKISG
jgi:hypothetical protein